jgi:hypothetical protein
LRFSLAVDFWKRLIGKEVVELPAASLPEFPEASIASSPARNELKLNIQSSDKDR